ncbi:type I polyketide synthase [Mycobacterium conspicuum]|uniref:Polyketide synthase n=1 Tax=Mycobacterium conspicuum TaxID=44010 RepID=A0A1X1T3L5_9MYCO|nr:type I polyketide synthase [Mycobacterium conspicuum]ORV39153.1 polyketide synthase [Mycobacterium conspicuum]BBZ39355.1 polyketide synthase [Mycobacterium conspicuum]
MTPDVAIIGLACRFPGAANADEFWRLLCDGLEVTQLPADVADFDADFFNLSPREARAMDPRQRLALELAWETFEDAFVVPETLDGEHVAVYLGAMNDDYALLTVATDNVEHHSFTGISRGMIANRLSFAFGLQGPSMTVDSGQSSSLVAVHLACESLRTGAAPLAIAGGVHLNMASETALLEAEFGAISPSGHTYAFDERADGYVRGEGGALVLLKPLSAALDDGDRIRAVIRGSAVGNAGHSAAGLTVTSVPGQADVIARALASAGLDAHQIDYVEAHGTGTAVGDPVEARALGTVFAERRRDPVSVGSVKTNIGHTGAAAGIAGLIKTVLAVENGLLPPSLNYVRPAIDLDSLGLRVNTALTPWPTGGALRRAGASSLGMGGTNAHVIVEQPPAVPESAAPQHNASEPTTAWVLSARSGEALQNQAARLLGQLSTQNGVEAGPSPADVGWSLATTRSVFEHRAVVVGADREQLMAQLSALAAGEPSPATVLGRAHPVGKTVFVFPGQGSQWLGMGQQLYDRFPVFAQAFDEAAAALQPHLRLPLRDVIGGTDADLLRSTEFAQPALFAVQAATAALLRSCGVVPDVVMGHSVGEITAAHVAGALSLAAAASVVAARGRLMADLPTGPDGGAMVAVAASADEVAPFLTEGVDVAAVNGPNSVVISGGEAAVGAVADRFAGAGRRVHRLAVSHAFHSALMEPMLQRFAGALDELEAVQPRIDLVSNLTGELAAPGYGSPQYWVDHVRRPVLFAKGVQTAESLGGAVFVEVGPGGGLMAAVEQSLTDPTTEHAAAVATLVKDRGEVDSLLAALGQLFTVGVPVDWVGVLNVSGVRRVALPTYGFARRRFWLGAGDSGGPEASRGEASRSAGFVENLRQLPPGEQHRQLLELVCAHAATVLGHSSSDDIDVERAFNDLGFDSMTGVELRNRLKVDTGLAGAALSRTLIFDYPTPTALADHLAHHLLGGHQEESDEERIWSALRKIPLQELRRTGLLDKLLQLAGLPDGSPRESTVDDDVIDGLSADALIAMALDEADDRDE